MKILNTMLGRQAIAAAMVLSLAIPMSVGAFAEEPAAAAAADDTVVAGYLPPQDESVMLQGEIALHSGDVAVGETDPAYGGYGAPEGDPIQGDIMLISADEAKTTEARYTVKGLLGRQVLYTARQEGRALARAWTEEKTSEPLRYPVRFLQCWHEIYDRLSTVAVCRDMLTDLQGVEITRDRLTLTVSSRRLAALIEGNIRLAKPILDYHYPGRTLHYRVPKGV